MDELTIDQIKSGDLLYYKDGLSLKKVLIQSIIRISSIYCVTLYKIEENKTEDLITINPTLYFKLI